MKQASSTNQNRPTPQETTPLKSKSLTAEGYTVKKGAENFYHLEIEIFQWKSQQGSPNPPVKTSTPKTVKFTPEDYRRFLEDNPRVGYTVNKILHDPDVEQTAKIQAEVEAAFANKKRLSK